MNESQKEAIQHCQLELKKALLPLMDVFLPYLQYRRVVSATMAETIEREKNSLSKLNKLLQHLENSENAWEALIAFLKEEGVGKLKMKLEACLTSIASTHPEAPLTVSRKRP